LFDSAIFIDAVSPVATCADAPADAVAMHSATASILVFMLVSGY
jgi:hypothetical protein